MDLSKNKRKFTAFGTAPVASGQAPSNHVPIAPRADLGDAALDRCLRWLGATGATWADGCDCVNLPDRGFCIMRGSVLPAGQAALAIPTHLALSFEAADSGVSGNSEPAVVEAIRKVRSTLCEASPAASSGSGEHGPDAPAADAVMRALSPGQELTEALSLALILHEAFVRGSASFWHPYFACIPAAAEEMGAAHWHPEELARGCLSGGAAHIAAELAAADAFLEAVARTVLLPLTATAPTLFPAEFCTMKNLRWSFAAWRARAMAPGVLVAGLEFGALLPGADFFNHSCGVVSTFQACSLLVDRPDTDPERPTSCSGPVLGRGKVAAIALSFGRAVGGALSSGQPLELLINYGAKETEHFVLFYGFVPSEGATTRVSLRSDSVSSSTGSTAALLVLHAPPPAALLQHAASLATARAGCAGPMAQLVSLLQGEAEAAQERQESCSRGQEEGGSKGQRRRSALAVAYHASARSVLEWHVRVLRLMDDAESTQGVPACDTDKNGWFNKNGFYEAAAVISAGGR